MIWYVETFGLKGSVDAEDCHQAFLKLVKLLKPTSLGRIYRASTKGYSDDQPKHDPNPWYGAVKIDELNSLFKHDAHTNERVNH